jgi:Ureidoglycolate hydrolase
MRKIKVQKLSVVDFAPFGSYTNILKPSGNHLGDFYYDPVRFFVSGEFPITFSTSIIHKMEQKIIHTVEYHDHTPEGILALDDDVIVHVAPPSKEPVPELTKAFLVPKGTLIMINAGVWHFSLMPVNKDEAHALIILPERTYKRDCTIVEYEQKDQMEIE